MGLILWDSVAVLQGVFDADRFFSLRTHINLTVALSRPAGNTSLPTGRQAEPCKAGSIGIGWVIEDFAKSELHQGWWAVVFDIRKVPL
jgi:hypothetical protein